MNGLRDKGTVGCEHEAAHFGVDCYIAHTVGNQDVIISLMDTFTDNGNVIRGLGRLIGYADAAGEVDEADICSGLLMKTDGQLEELSGEFRIVLIGDGIAGKECMDAKVLDALLHEGLESGFHLALGHSVFGVSGVIHDTVGHLEDSAGIETATHGLRQFTAACLFAEVDMGNIIQVDDGANLLGIGIFLSGSVIGGEHDVVSVQIQCLTEHELHFRGTVGATVVLIQDLDDFGVRSGFDGKVLAVARVPGEGFLYSGNILADSLFIIEIERGRIGFGNFFYLFLGDKCFLFHRGNSFILILQSR